MAKVSMETVGKLRDFIESLPDEAKSKCGICSETLTHIVKTAEVETGAGTSTITNALAHAMNEDAAPGDKVTGNALNQRVRQKSGEKKRNLSNGQDKPEPESESEKQRRSDVESGMTVVANMKTDDSLIQWAKDEGLFVRIDRGSPWGNPFKIPDDGDRQKVCFLYDHYFESKTKLKKKIEFLRGKVLGCWCYPDQCHGDHLAMLANGPPKAETFHCDVCGGDFPIGEDCDCDREPEEKAPVAGGSEDAGLATMYAKSALNLLRQIRKSDTDAAMAFDGLIHWIFNRKKELNLESKDGKPQEIPDFEREIQAERREEAHKIAKSTAFIQ